jgi:hypothetical protein
MQYLLLIYSNENPETKPSVEEFQASIAAHRALMDETERKGILLGVNPLKPSTTATTIRKTADGKPLITDGPFAETKEQLAGYYLLECKDLDEAISFAQKIPLRCASGAANAVEVRPVRPFSEIQEQLESLVSEQHA